MCFLSASSLYTEAVAGIVTDPSVYNIAADEMLSATDPVLQLDSWFIVIPKTNKKRASH